MKYFLSVLLCAFFANAIAQNNVGIGTTTPNASAVLDVSSTNKGFLMPRMTTAQRNAISFPARGLQIVNTDDGCIDLFDGSGWTKNCGLKTTGTATFPAGNWIKRAESPLSVSDQFANGFAIGNKIYYTALNTDNAAFLEYDINTKIWTAKAPFAGQARTGGIGFSIGSKGYIGLGWNFGGYKIDLWEYDPSNNTWTRRADYPGIGVYSTVGFNIGTKGYVCTGRHNFNTTTNDLYEYDPLFNTWTPKASYPGNGKSGAIGFVVADKAYVGVGDYNENDIWEYTQSTNSWQRKADFPWSGRVLASAFTIGTDGYVGLGQGGAAFQDLWKYSTTNNSWTRMTDIDGPGRYGALGVSIGTSGFIVGGNFGLGEPGDVWEYTGAPAAVPLLSQSGLPNAVALNTGGWTKVSNDVYQSGTGNVGIGITAPDTKLHLAGSLKIFDGTQGADKVLTSDANGLASWQALPVLPADVWTTVGNNIFYNSTGNVGIGLARPNAQLQFSNTVQNRKIVLFEGADNDHEFYGFGINGATLRYQTSGSDADHVFFSGINATSSKELMRIKGNGNIGIGVDDAQFKLDVNGRVRIRATPGLSAGTWLNNDANTSSNAFVGMRSDTEVGIYGQTGTPNWRFYVNTSTGNATLQGVLTQNSDARLKKDIQPLQSALENIETISGYQYHWKEEGRDSAQQIGLLAQEVQKMYPQLVKEDSNGTLSVNYSGMVPVLLEAIKEQQKQIDEMKKAIQLLQEK
jgi:N-acetylneuraminic acid mutarotase